MSKKIYVKLIFENQGVVDEVTFDSASQADLFYQGAVWALDTIDDDAHHISMASFPATEEE